MWNNFTNDARVRREVSALAEAGYEVDVICTYDGDEKEIFREETYKGSRVRRVWNYDTLKLKNRTNKTRYQLLLFLDRIKLGRVINAVAVVINMIRYGIKEGYDYYHCNDLKTLPQGYICKKIIAKRKIRLIYDSHEVETSRAGGKARVKYILERYLIKRVDQVIMTTDTRAEYNAKLYNIDKPAVIHNYPVYREKDMSRNNLYEELQIDKSEPILLYQGGFQKGRGIEKILEATKEFHKGVVVFIGDGPLKSTMDRLIKDYGIEDKVKIMPKVEADELLYYTQHAYLGFQVLENTCFNHYSALSNKLLEYIMMEVPVICSKLPEMEKVISVTGAGICVNVKDSNTIVNIVNEVLNNNNKYEDMKIRCQKIKSRYTWEREKNKFIGCYEYGGVKCGNK